MSTMMTLSEAAAAIPARLHGDDRGFEAVGSDSRTLPERALFVALSTVQGYIKGLYRKLDVHSGVQAVARARELELLR